MDMSFAGENGDIVEADDVSVLVQKIEVEYGALRRKEEKEKKEKKKEKKR